MAVFTKIYPNEMLEFLSSYDIGKLLKYEGIGAGVENTNYFVNTTKANLVLTIFEKIPFHALEFFVGLMKICNHKNIPAPKPIFAKNHHFIQSIQNKPAILVKKIPGMHNFNPSQARLKSIAQTTANMHFQLKCHPQKPPNSRNLAWMQKTYQQIKPKLNQANRKLIEYELNFQKNTHEIILPKGLIHGDLFRDNVLFEKQKVSGIIDFYFACYDVIILDFAIFLNDWCFDEDLNFNNHAYQTVCTYYQKIRPFTPSEKKHFTRFLRLAALRFYLSRLIDQITPTIQHVGNKKDPEEYEYKLYFHQKHTKEL